MPFLRLSWEGKQSLHVHALKYYPVIQKRSNHQLAMVPKDKGSEIHTHTHILYGHAQITDLYGIGSQSCQSKSE